MQLADAVKRMRGKPGSKVTVTIAREGWTEPQDFAIVREQIHIQSVRSQELEDGIEYIRLRQFQEQTASDLDQTLERAEKSGLKGLVLDLRNNPGGLLTSAVEVTEKFIDDGKLVVYTEGRIRNQNMRFTAHAKHPLLGVPMVVMVNQGSASASRDRGGRASGLGPGDRARHAELRQGVGPDDHPALRRLRAAADDGQVLHAEGRSIHGKGITPDIVVEPPKVVAAAPAPGDKEPKDKTPPVAPNPVEDVKKDRSSSARSTS